MAKILVGDTRRGLSFWRWWGSLSRAMNPERKNKGALIDSEPTFHFRRGLLLDWKLLPKKDQNTTINCLRLAFHASAAR